MGPLSLIDSEALLESVAASVVAGVGIAVAFSLAIYGSARFADARRGEAPLAAGLAALLTVLALLACAAAITAAILAMTSGRT
jgi:hypothetical protein